MGIDAPIAVTMLTVSQANSDALLHVAGRMFIARESYVLDFFGRVLQSSVKNFQLIDRSKFLAYRCIS